MVDKDEANVEAEETEVTETEPVWVTELTEEIWTAEGVERSGRVNMVERSEVVERSGRVNMVETTEAVETVNVMETLVVEAEEAEEAEETLMEVEESRMKHQQRRSSPIAGIHRRES